MNVKMPDGTVIANVPEGTTQEDLQGRLDASRRPVTPMGERFLHGLADPIYGAGQLADRVLVNPIRQMISPGATSMEDVMRERQAEYKAPEGVDWMRAAGAVANPINYMGGGVTSLARAAPEAAATLSSMGVRQAAEHAMTLPGMAASGAVQGALNPTAADQSLADFAIDKAKQVAGGAAGGVVGGGLGKLVARTALPAGVPTVTRMAASQRGIDRTLGQTMVAEGQAGGKAVDAAERWLSDVPISGGPITKSRAAAVAASEKQPHLYEADLASMQMPYEAVKYQPALRELATDLPVTRTEREAAGNLFDQIRMKYMGNTSGVQPSMLAAHGIETEMRDAATQAGGAQGKLLAKIADDFKDAWRGKNLNDAEKQIVSGYADAFDRARARATAAAAPAREGIDAALSRVLARGLHFGAIAGPTAFVAGLPKAAAIGAAGWGYGTRPVQNYLTGRASPAVQRAILQALRAGAPSAGVAGAAEANDYAKE